MSNPSIQSLIQTGTKLYLDSIDPKLVKQNIEWGAVGATSNPIIVSALVRSGRFDDSIASFIAKGQDDETICWNVTDALVREAQEKFLPIWEKTSGNAGWVSFELDPLVEDSSLGLTHQQQVARYIELGLFWWRGHKNRMIKVPATPAGLDAVETLASQGVALNVTLIFTKRQYELARDAVWRGAQKRESLDGFKSVYSIFVSRIDQYTLEKHPDLSKDSQGQYGILNAKRLWLNNQTFWASHQTPLEQEIIFASTGTKNPADVPWKYVAALAGSDIQTNPPETNLAVSSSGQQFVSRIKEMLSTELQAELDAAIDIEDLEKVLMEQGIAKFVAPQKQLLETIRQKRQAAN
ncbi:MAG: transaldolase [Pirellula sp.]|jgi:transaldolase|nr:transaldolase [Pirellula sp.]